MFKVRPAVRKRHVIILVLMTIIAIASLPFLIYRLPKGHSRIVEREIRYQMIDLGQLGGWRCAFEEQCGNKRLFLNSEVNEQNWVYVSKEDFKKCWAIPPFDLRRDTTTFIAVLQLTPLFFSDGYAPAKLTELKRIHKMPLITK